MGHDGDDKDTSASTAVVYRWGPTLTQGGRGSFLSHVRAGGRATVGRA